MQNPLRWLARDARTGWLAAGLVWAAGRLPAAILVLVSLLPTASHAIEVVRWERLPLSVTLRVGEERILFVDRPVRVAVPSAIAEHLRVQSADGAVYLRASAPFEVARLELQDADTGALILLDVKSTQVQSDDTPLEPMRILIGRQPGVAPTPDPDRPPRGESAESLASTATPTAMLLTRYAAQSLYAPLRTVEPVSGIAPTPVHRTLDLSTLIPTLPVSATVLSAWRLQDQWVTALRLTNLTHEWLRLDPRALQGDFVAATFQHRDLGPQGASTDTTVLYVVTHGHGLAESLLPAVSPVDAASNLPAPKASASDHEQ